MFRSNYTSDGCTSSDDDCDFKLFAKMKQMDSNSTALWNTIVEKVLTGAVTTNDSRELMNLLKKLCPHDLRERMTVKGFKSARSNFFQLFKNYKKNLFLPNTSTTEAQKQYDWSRAMHYACIIEMMTRQNEFYCDLSTSEASLATLYNSSLKHPRDGIFDNLTAKELKYLQIFRDCMRVALTVIPANQNKGALLNACSILEGSGERYETGGEPSEKTRRRVFIFEHFSGTKPEKREERKPGSTKKPYVSKKASKRKSDDEYSSCSSKESTSSSCGLTQATKDMHIASTPTKRRRVVVKKQKDFSDTQSVSSVSSDESDCVSPCDQLMWPENDEGEGALDDLIFDSNHSFFTAELEQLSVEEMKASLAPPVVNFSPATDYVVDELNSLEMDLSEFDDYIY